MNRKINLEDVFSLALLALIWGSSFILIKKSLIALSPVQVGTLRVIISMIVLLPFAWTRKNEFFSAPKAWIFAVGVIGSAIPAVLFSYAQTKIESSLAGLLNTLTPIWVIIFGVLFFSLSVTKYKVLGVGLGFIGALILILFSTDGEFTNVLYGLLILVATFCYATSVNIIKAKLATVSALTTTVYSYILAGILVSPIFIYTWDAELIQSSGFTTSLVSVCVLAVFGTAFGSVIFFRLIQRTDPVFSSMVTYLIPIVALAWGFWDGESITVFHLIGIVVILAGVWLSGKGQSRISQAELKD